MTDTYDPVVELAEFVPTDAMRMAKAAFWSRCEELPMVDPDKVTLAQAINLTNNTTLSKWWKIPGFQDYFTNRNEWKTRIEYLANLSLEVAEDILRDPKAPAAARVAMIRTLNEFANKLPQRAKETKVLDAHVSKMSEQELVEFVRKNQHLIEEISESEKDVVNLERHRAKAKKKVVQRVETPDSETTTEEDK